MHCSTRKSIRWEIRAGAGSRRPLERLELVHLRQMDLSLEQAIQRPTASPRLLWIGIDHDILLRPHIPESSLPQATR